MTTAWGRIAFATDLAAWCERYRDNATTALTHPGLAPDDRAFLAAQRDAAEAMAASARARAAQQDHEPAQQPPQRAVSGSGRRR